MNIGEVIKLARIKNKMTQEVLARKLETSKNSVVAWEKGHYSPNGEMLIKIGIVLDIVSDLFPVKKILNDIQQNMKILSAKQSAIENFARKQSPAMLEEIQAAVQRVTS